MKSIVTFFIILAISVAVSTKIYYDGFKVYKVIPRNEDEVRVVTKVQKSGIGDVWNEIFDVDNDVKIMVAPKNQAQFLEIFKKDNIVVTEVIGDVQEAINNQMNPSNIRTSESMLSYSWDRYHNLDTLYTWFDELATAYPNIVTVVDMGKSYESRDIKGVILNFKPERKNRLIGVLEGTLHAREWIAAAYLTWTIKEFLTSNDEGIRTLAENFEWHIFPVVNPDGYVYTFTTHRMWRKNRNPISSKQCAEGVNDDMSNGIDLNRNFDFMWTMLLSASNDSCSNLYIGPEPNSEPETRAIIQYLLNLNDRGKIMYYISVHSFTQLIIIPFSHLENGSDPGQPSNYADSYEIAKRGAHALNKRFGTTYRVGVAAEHLYPMSGTSFDWVKYMLDIPLTYLFELRDLGDFGFLLPAEQIIPTSLETMDALIEMDRTAQALGYYQYESSAYGAVYSMVLVLFGVLVCLLA